MFRKEKLASLIQERAAEFFRTEVAPGIIITVTDVAVSADTRNATIFITLLPDKDEKTILHKLEHDIGELKNYIHSHAEVGHLPELRIQIDRGEKLRHHIDTLLK